MTPIPLHHSLPTPRQEHHDNGMLLLENGTLFRGQGLGVQGEVIGEVCFQTSMTGYQEVITDPSYRGQIVVFTTPHIGNVGTTEEDNELAFPNTPLCEGIVIRDAHVVGSNFRGKQSLCQWLEDHNMTALNGVDTRALVRIIRQEGLLRGAIVYASNRSALPSPEDVLKRVLKHPTMSGQNLSGQNLSGQNLLGQSLKGGGLQQEGRFSSSPKKGKEGAHLLILDYGMKVSLAHVLSQAGARVSVLPGTSSVDAILAQSPHGVLLSNGPGDPTAVEPLVLRNITRLMGRVPLFGVCFGHQLLGLALGGTMVKMHQGHHGANHPVLELKSGRAHITSMNHGFALESKTLPQDVVETHQSLFDGSNCGIEKQWSGSYVGSVQFHPEASPGPHDTRYLLKDFAKRCGDSSRRG